MLCLGAAPKSPSTPVGSSYVERSQLHMGTLLTVRIEADDHTSAVEASERVFAAVAAAETRLSTWRGDTELARLNAAAQGVDVALSPETVADLATAMDCSRLTEGAFDPTVGPLVSAWGLRDGGRLAAPADIDAALRGVGIDGLALTESSAQRIHPDLRLDEGGFGKGAALDDAAATLAATASVRSAILDFGGQLLVYSRDAQTEARANVAVAHPDQRERLVAEFTVGSGSVATTGNGERGVVVDGRDLGHVLDPRSGRIADDFGSLTVWTDPSLDSAATLADCLSTGLYVLGADAALEFAAGHVGIEVLVAERMPDDVRIRASAGISFMPLPSTTLSDNPN